MFKKWQKKSIGIILTLAMVLSLMPALTLTASAYSITNAVINEPYELNMRTIIGSDVDGWVGAIYANPYDGTHYGDITTPGGATYCDTGTYDIELVYFRASYAGDYSFDIIYFDAAETQHTINVSVRVSDSANTAPTFKDAGEGSLTVAANASAADVIGLLHASDTDTTSQTLTWSQATGGAPSHGTLSFTSATATSGSADITPGGTITYTPTVGYSGSDSFIVQVYDGTATAERTINVTVNSTSGLVTEHFSAGTTGNAAFTCGGMNFTLDGGNLTGKNVTGYGWKGTETDNYFADNFSTLISSAGAVGSIHTDSGTFKVHNLYVFPGITGAQVSGAGTVVIKGSLGGVEKFTKTLLSTNINTSSYTNGGWTYVDFESDDTYSIDTLEFSLTGELRYLAIDAFQHESTAAAIAPTLTSAAYNASTGVLDVTGENMTIDDTITVGNLTVTGQGGSYTLTSANVTADSATAFRVNLNAADQLNVNGLLNKNGASSVGGTAYNLAGAANWDATRTTPADMTDNAITVSNVYIPTITSAAYNAATGVLTVTGTSLIKQVGATNDINVSKLTLTGEGGATYTLTTNSVEITSATEFAVTLNATDIAAAGIILNTNGLSSTGGTAYNLAAADDWNSNIGDSNISDGTCAVTVSNVTLPSAVTSAASSVSSTAATLNGTVNANGTETTVTFEYGTTNSYGTAVTATQSPVTGTSATSVSCALTGLTPNRTYYYRVKAVNTAGTTYGSDATFTTSAIAPTATTDAASGISSTGATLNSTVNPNNASSIVRFDYGTTDSYGTTVTVLGPVTGTSATSVSYALTGLTPSTTYHYRVKAVNTAGTTYGLDATFTTSNTAPAFAGTTMTLTVNKNASATDVTGLLHVSDTDGSQTLTWSQNTAPSHGALTIADKSDGTGTVTAASGIADITPGGTITYTPTAGYSGSDSFAVQVSDGVTTATRTITVSVLDCAAVGTIVRFNNADWLCFSTTGGYKLLRKDFCGTSAYGSVPYSGSTIRNYLNTTFYNTFSANQKAQILSATWNCGYASNESLAQVTDNVGLLTVSEYNSISDASWLVKPNDYWWLITPYSGGAAQIVYWDNSVSYFGVLTTFINVRPALYLKSDVTFRLIDGKYYPAGEPMPTYTVTYDAESGTVSPASQVKRFESTFGKAADGTDAAMPTPDRTGYTFVGWYDGDDGTGNLITDASTVTVAANQTLHAKWTAGIYDITYTLNGGTSAGDNDATYTFGTGFALSPATRTGYTFWGWYSNSGFTGSAVLTIENSDYGDKTLYARWRDNTVSAAPESVLSEASLDTNSLTVTLNNTTFADATLDKANFTLTNGAAIGLTVESVTHTDTDSTHCTVNLAYDGTDFDANVTNVSLTVAAAELACGTALTTDMFTITPTVETAPTVTTASITTYDKTSATMGGNVTADGGESVTERGVVYSITDTTPEIGESGVTKETNGNGTGAFSESIGSLTPGTTYHIRAYATNSVGTSYGALIDFTSTTEITSATYNASTGVLAVTASNMAADDVIAVNKLTITGDGGSTYTLTSSNVAASNATAFSVTLNDTDKAAVDQILNKNGTSSVGGTIYNIAGADGWDATKGESADLTGNGITVSGIIGITGVTLPSNGTYSIGDSLDFTVQFDAEVSVTDNSGANKPYILINLAIGGPVKAYLQSGSGTSTLVFRYTVAAGEIDSDGIALVSPISLNTSGTMKDGSGNNVSRFFTASFATGILIDGIAPTVMGMAGPSAGTYLEGEHLDFTATFSEAVTVTGAPYITLTVGSTTVNAAYVSGTGTTSLTFRYTVLSGNEDANGIASTDSITLNDGTIKDAAGNAATLTFTAPTTSAVLVDAVAPTITLVTPPVPGTYKVDDHVDFTATFSEAVTVTGTPYISLVIGSSTVHASYVNVTGTTSLTFRYTVLSGDADSDGIACATSITLSGGTIKDAAGNDATLTFTAPTTSAVLVDTTAPTISTGTITTSEVASRSVKLTWKAATDTSDLLYKVVYSKDDNISTVSDA